MAVKINFSDITIFTDVEHKVATRQDIKKNLADSIYQHGQGIVFHALALKIYNSKNDVELDDDEYKLLIDYARQMCTPAIIDALEAYGNQSTTIK